MKNAAAAIALLALVTPCLAQARPSTLTMACGQTRRLVDVQGSVVLSTGEYTFDRFVNTRGFCPKGTFSRPAFVATRDNPQCDIGFYCSSAPPLFGDE